jgi:hypothetical protein
MMWLGVALTWEKTYDRGKNAEKLICDLRRVNGKNYTLLS